MWYKESVKRILDIAIILALAILCFLRNEVWTSDGTLWMDIAAKSPNKARGYNEIGLHYINAHEYEKALEAFKRLLALDPYLPTVYTNLGLAYEGLGRIDLALATYEKAATLNPTDPTAYYNMGILYYQNLKNRARALEFFIKARDLNPLEPDVHQYLGLIYRDQGRQDLADEEFRLFAELK